MVLGIKIGSNAVKQVLEPCYFPIIQLLADGISSIY